MQIVFLFFPAAKILWLLPLAAKEEEEEVVVVVVEVRQIFMPVLVFLPNLC